MLTVEPHNIIGRFAPSPSGNLHIGNAYSALFSWRTVRELGGTFLLRIEDIDLNRCREDYESAIYEDLAWLGIDWDGVVRRQSDNVQDFKRALARLRQMGVLYPCFCSRSQIRLEASKRWGTSKSEGPLGVIYPGTCQHVDPITRRSRMQAGEDYAHRLNLAAAVALAEEKLGGPLTWTDFYTGDQVCDPSNIGDPVLWRKDNPASYNLAVVVDDGLQGVNLVTRGMDIYYATHIHRVLQVLLDIPAPMYIHHKLVNDHRGERLSKTRGSTSIRHMRESGMRLEDVYRMIGWTY